ncbi:MULTISPECIES: carboxy-S-adenosyl-L-methionine synthase CmoA [Gammaproteobacteria]|uniref:carboxy-S-adenosyl-L-methionine synthase CmoA n=1 Tax=Gammaproteobacteria TaxID=1236 RepID=UPI000DD0D2E5|nr:MULTISPECIES: carboxy-S-adenosyl-L-methionine synthase CmoA [Gammaproteobacteria]RTE86101.1 carboxy-S-adenosyl-L-methionine synthase CmoA [Aliidiomarina sp. B3213]TCZ91454.1 carboxy-S-adenosyl-L-methionine synthase CmoA [Lysobacter sp. N42]
MNFSRDSIYAKPLGEVADFSFDENVANVFPDMISRSVPGYSTMVQTIGHLAGKFAQPNSYIYDLGCSLGAATIAMKQHIQAAGTQIIGVDNSEAMVSRCQSNVNAWKGDVPVTIRCEDILDTEFQPCSVVAMNFTLQFIPPEQREQLIRKIYDALLPGGIFLLSEKVRHEDTQAESVLNELHHDFKRMNGYSDLEISQKRAAIENVMRIDTPEKHIERLSNVGFDTVQNWYRCFNFTSWFAIKSEQNK